MNPSAAEKLISEEEEIVSDPSNGNGAFEAWPPRRKVPRFGRIRIRVGAPLMFDSAAEDRSGWSRVAAETEWAVRRLSS
jgi:hypothetical protein